MLVQVKQVAKGQLVEFVIKTGGNALLKQARVVKTRKNAAVVELVDVNDGFLIVMPAECRVTIL
jgi:hypothetical protein